MIQDIPYHNIDVKYWQLILNKDHYDNDKYWLKLYWIELPTTTLSAQVFHLHVGENSWVIFASGSFSSTRLWGCKISVSQNEKVKARFLLVWAICGSELSPPSARAAGGFYLTCHSTKAWRKPPSRWRIIASSLYLFVFIRCRMQHQPLSCGSAWLSVIRQEFESDGSDNKFNLVRQIKRWRLLKVSPDLFCDWSTPS